MKCGNVGVNKLFVVGDKFKCFITNNNVIGISQLEDMIKDGDCKDLSSGCEIYVGQGVCEIQMRKISEEVRRKKLQDVFKIAIPEYYKKSTKCLTHKHRNENIMISEPARISDFKYKCFLVGMVGLNKQNHFQLPIDMHII